MVSSFADPQNAVSGSKGKGCALPGLRYLGCAPYQAVLIVWHFWVPAFPGPSMAGTQRWRRLRKTVGLKGAARRSKAGWTLT